MNFKEFLNESGGTGSGGGGDSISFGVVKTKLLKALNYMNENLGDEIVKEELKELDCPGCKNEGDYKNLVDSLIKLVEGTQKRDDVTTQLYKRLKKKFSFIGI